MAQRFKPGEAVPRDGIYRVLHKNHREAHLNELRRGDTFPPCRQCGQEVRFEAAPETDTSSEGEPGLS
jgi:hypothetical protein